MSLDENSTKICGCRKKTDDCRGAGRGLFQSKREVKWRKSYCNA